MLSSIGTNIPQYQTEYYHNVTQLDVNFKKWDDFILNMVKYSRMIQAQKELHF